MAMNLKALNIGLGKGKADAKPAPKEKPAKRGAVSATTTFDAGKKSSPLLGGKSFRTRMQALIIALAFLVFVVAVTTAGAVVLVGSRCAALFLGAALVLQRVQKLLAHTV